MKSKKTMESLRRFFGKGTHLYQNSQRQSGWLIVPMRWRQGQYTVSYFSPTGVRYINWENHASIQAALANGLELVQAQVALVVQPATSTNSTQSLGA